MPRKSAQGRRDGVLDADGAGGLWGGGEGRTFSKCCAFVFALQTLSSAHSLSSSPKSQQKKVEKEKDNTLFLFFLNLKKGQPFLFLYTSLSFSLLSLPPLFSSLSTSSPPAASPGSPRSTWEQAQQQKPRREGRTGGALPSQQQLLPQPALPRPTKGRHRRG